MSGQPIAFLINTLGGGGAERVVTRLSSSLATQGRRVLIICLNSSQQAYPLHTGVAVHILIRERTAGNFVARIQYAWQTFYRLMAVLKREKPGCLIAFMTSANIWAGLTAGLRKIPYIVSERNAPQYGVHQLGFFSLRLCAALYRRAAALVLPSAGIGEGLKRKKVFAGLSNDIVIHNPVESRIDYAPARVYEKPFMLAVGRLTYQKGFDQLVTAYSKLGPSAPDLLIAGQGEEEQALRHQISELGLTGRVILLGAIKQLQGYYLQAELFILSSRNEGYPNVLIEAMSCGCAVIATNCEFGPSEIIRHAENGLLVENSNPPAMASAIRRLLRDHRLRNKLGHAAARIRETNSIEQISGRWLALVNHSTAAGPLPCTETKL
ncbi:glycosyltransferase family 4 protein [Pedobacter yulinensis]|uniref:Glycosyltransferase family 4 protein n=1 Tax=Pedobacter yulinensis TaxID=2126353 RepID=A0A2T3HLF9_9SPHI|nr:glycosyltransferase [Pedobacter yulinensis]PST83259.1 glycosyltransferase family 4 protein [Pedobacter yulinensis]